MRPGEWRRQLLSVDSWDYQLMVRVTVRVLTFPLLLSIPFHFLMTIRYKICLTS